MLATGADLPPELLLRILSYVGTNDRGKGEAWDRAKGDGLQELKSCSLVCVYWAIQCRHVLFYWRWIHVRSSEEMKSLDFFAKHGSKRFPLLGNLLQGWKLEQTWTARSWCHTRYGNSFRLKKDKVYSARDGRYLTLQGPVPSSLPLSALHSPHWSLPRSMPICSTVFVILELKNIHFPSLSSLSKLLRQFRSLQRISLETITWCQDETMHIAPVLFPKISKLTASARACTNNLHIARQAYDTLCSGSSFKQLRSRERHACIDLIRTILQVIAVDPTESVGPTFTAVNEIDANASFGTHYCSFENTLRSVFQILNTLRSPNVEDAGVELNLHALAIPAAPAHRRYVQLHVLVITIIPFGASPAFRVQSLQPWVDQLPSLRIAVIYFMRPYPFLKAVVDASPALREPLASTHYITYRFMCLRSRELPFVELPYVHKGREIVEIDPITLNPTGATWSDALKYDTEARLLKRLVRHYNPELLPSIPDF